MLADLKPAKYHKMAPAKGLSLVKVTYPFIDIKEEIDESWKLLDDIISSQN